MEHHSNIVPWQLVAEQTGATLRAVPVTDTGELDLEAFDRLLTDRTRLVAVTHLSNALGTINPVRVDGRCARAGARHRALVDGAQSAPHLPVDVQALGCDFFAFSGHKMFGPTGIGVLYGRAALLEAMPPWQGGGDMIETVTIERSTWAPPPARFEAGTPPIARGHRAGRGARVRRGGRARRDRRLRRSCSPTPPSGVGELDGVRLIGTAREKASVLSFVVEGVHPHDVGAVLDDEGVAIRAGHHCAQPLMRRFGVPATARASFAFYNTRAEVDALVRGIARVRSVFA